MTLYLIDFVVVIHALFIIFVLFGGLIVLKWHQVMWIHIDLNQDIQITVQHENE